MTEPDIIEQTKSYPGANVGEPAENVRAMRALAEAVERAVRGDRKDVLGLDWGTE